MLKSVIFHGSFSFAQLILHIPDLDIHRRQVLTEITQLIPISLDSARIVVHLGEFEVAGTLGARSVIPSLTHRCSWRSISSWPVVKHITDLVDCFLVTVSGVLGAKVDLNVANFCDGGVLLKELIDHELLLGLLLSEIFNGEAELVKRVTHVEKVVHVEGEVHFEFGRVDLLGGSSRFLPIRSFCHKFVVFLLFFSTEIFSVCFSISNDIFKFKFNKNPTVPILSLFYLIFQIKRAKLSI